MSDTDDKSQATERPLFRMIRGLLPVAALEAARRRWRGLLILFVGLFATLMLMANDQRLPFGVIWGFATMLVALGGLLDTLGVFDARADDERSIPWRETPLAPLEGEPSWCAPMYTVPAALAVFALGAAALGLAGLPWVILATLILLAPSAVRRPGWLVFVLVCAMYLPLLGTYGLWDPWETHYGEVTREILARDDWISLWWAQENWFWSKPILIFWTEALSFGALGVDYAPDANPFQPEWAVRLPVVTMSLCAAMAVYFAIGRIFSKRAGVLSALVLATMPHFYMLAHQAITDIPFVANVTVAMSLLVLALTDDPKREVLRYRFGRAALSMKHLVLGALFTVAIPQALYLVSRNVAMVRPFQFAWHVDAFVYGSAGNSGSPPIPGNAVARDMTQAVWPWQDTDWWSQLLSIPGQPAFHGLMWALGLGCILWLHRKEQRSHVLLMTGFYLFCALGFMGKGIPGVALPGLVALLYLLVSTRWHLLLEGRLRVAVGALTVVVAGVPWFVAEYFRHGPAFTDRLLVHDHINRLASGVHGDTGSIEYFLEQLGPAMFPWVGLVLPAFVMWLWYRPRPVPASTSGEIDPQRETLLVLSLWLLAAFTLFSAMITKFHHYIFPVVPAAAILVGIMLDRLFGKSRGGTPALLLAMASPVVVAIGIAGWWGNIRGVIPEEVPTPERATWGLEHGWSPGLAVTVILLGVLLGVASWFLMRREGPAPEQDGDKRLGAALAAAAVVIAFVGRDLSWITDGRPQGYERPIQLFIYNYARPWPDHFDYRPVFTAVAIVATLLVALAVFRALRPVAARGLLAIALASTVWTLDVYIPDLAPHWGQQILLEHYYDERDGPEETLIAWQMNWKGENFYSGNHVSVFVDLDNAKLRQWITEHAGERTFFMLEHTRLGSFRSLVPGKQIREVTTMRECNKFLLIEVTL